MKFHIRRGLEESHRAVAAGLYWEAFAGKLGPALNPCQRAQPFLEKAINPDACVTAIADDGSLLGVAGFKTKDGGFVEGDFDLIRKVYGLIGAL